MERIAQDLRFAVRGLFKHPGLTAIAVLSLGLGIGANATVFTWLQAFVLRPLPVVPGYDRLVSVDTRAPDGGTWSLSYPDYADQRAQTTTVDLALYDFQQLGMRDGADIERVWGMVVSDNYFDVLGVRPALGRTFLPGEEERRAQVAVLGWSFWQRRFAGDSAVIGRSLTLGGQSFVVVGVAPPRFAGTIVGLQFDVFVPVTALAALTPDWARRLEQRGWQDFDAVGRVRDGVTMAHAIQELDRVARSAGIAGGVADHRGAVVVPLTDDTEGAASFLGPVFIALIGITAVVLLIACANVANLLLARAAARRREIGIRIAVGANRSRIVRQLLTESFLLAACSCGLGILVAFWGRDLLTAFIPAAPFPIGIDLTVDGRVFAFAFLVTAGAALAFGLVPALQASNPELTTTLKDEIGAGAPHRARMQSALVVGQVALSLVSLVAAGLFLRALQASRQVDTGFSEPERVLLAVSDLGLAGIRGDSMHLELSQRLLERVRALPGVEHAALASHVPLGFGGYSSTTTGIDGYTPQPDENMSLRRVTVSGGYFATMGTVIVRGREFSDADVASDADVVVVNENFVRRYLGTRDPIGVTVSQGGRQFTIVGVARDIKQEQLNEPPRAVVYRAYGLRRAPSDWTLHVRTAGDPASVTASLRRVFTETSVDLPFLDVRTLAESMQASVFVQRIGAAMLAAFGLLALALAGIGIYGTMAYQVSRRVREIGVRVALGAARRDVVQLVVGRALRLAGLGLVLGLVLAAGAGQLMQAMLLGISPRDPVTFVAIGLLLAAVALLASWIPARRAARVDPMVALRYE